MICPPKHTQPWKDLVLAVGEFQATKDWMENNNQVRTPEKVLNKLQKPSINNDLSIAFTRQSLTQLQRFKRDFAGNINTQGFLNMKTDLGDAQRALLGSGFSLKPTMYQGVQNGWKVIDDKTGAKVNPLDFYRESQEEQAQRELLDSPDAENGYKKQLPFQMDKTSVQIARGNEILKKLVQNLSDRFNTAYRFITPEEAKEISPEWNGEPGFYDPSTGVVYFVNDRLTPLVALHEFAHPFLDAIEAQNPELLKSLYSELKGTSEGMGIITETDRLYPDRDLAYKIKEALVRSLSLKADNMRNQVNETSAFKTLINKILYHFKQLLRKLFPGEKINVQDLDVNTNLNELAKMLLSENFNIETSEVSDSDLSFSRYQDYEKDAKLIEDKMPAMVKKMWDTAIKNFQNTLDPDTWNKIKSTLSKGEEFQPGAILSALSKITGPAGEKMRKDFGDQKLYVEQTKALVQTLEKLLYANDKILNDTNLIDPKKTPSKSDMVTIDAYMNYVKHWKPALEWLNSQMVGLPKDSYIRNILNQARTQISDIESSYLPVIKKGMVAYLAARIEPFRKSVEESYKKDFERYAKKGASPKLLKKLKDEYDRDQVTMDKLEQDLDGTSMDAGLFNTYIESWMYSSDRVTGAWHRVISEQVREGQNKALEKFSNFIQRVVPIIRAAGYNTKDLTGFASKFVQKERIGYKENDEFKEGEVLRFINAHTGWDFENQKKRFELAQLRKKAEDSGEWDQYLQASKDYRKFQQDYAYRPFLDEVYQSDKVLDESPYGEKARMLEDDIQDRIDDLYGDIIDGDEEALLSIGPDLESLYKEKRKLRSLKDDDGNYKTGDSLEIAKLLQQRSELGRLYREWKVNPALFQKAYSKIEQQLLDRGLTKDSPEFQDLMNRWKDSNMVTKLTDEYYALKSTILDNIRRIYALAVNPSPQALELAKTYKDISDIIYGYRDQDGQPVGTDMSPSTLTKLKDLQEKTEKLRKEVRSGLSDEENYEKEQLLSQTIRGGPGLDPEQRDRLSDLIHRSDTSGLNMSQKTELSKYFKQLSDIEGKEPTEYYLDIFNNYLSKLPDDLKERLISVNKSAEIDKNSADFVINLPKSVLEDVLKSVPGFEDWFRANHIKRELFNLDTQKMYKQWERTSAWTVKTPLDDRYLQKTNVIDNEDKTVELPGVPNTRFQQYKVKDEYKTGYNPKTGTIDLVPGKHFDIRKENRRDQWLPRPKSEGGLDDHFFNQEYLNMSKDDPTRFKILEAIKQEYYSWQRDTKDKQVRLGNDIPRYQKHGLESFQTPGALGNFGSRMSQLIRNVGQRLALKNADPNYERDYLEDIKNASLDSFDTDPSIPVSGLYRMEAKDVTLDFFHSMGKYLSSLENYKQMTEILPIARDLERILDNPGAYSNAIDTVNTRNRISGFFGMFGGKIGKKNRTAAVHHMNEKYIYGIGRTGLFSDNLAVNKVMNLMLRGASFSTLGLNIPTAGVIAITQHLQNWVEANGGKYFNRSTWAWGSMMSFKVMADISFEVNKVGNNSLHIQLVNAFNVLQGKSPEKIGANIARTLGRDTVSLSWFFSPLKWMESEASISQFMAMMKFKKIPQTLNGKTSEISYIDAWKLKDGVLSLVDGVDSTWGVNGEEFKSYLLTIDKLQRDLIGSFDSFGQPEIYRYALGKMFLFLRKHMASMIANRWAATRPDFGKMEMSTGYYWKALKSFQNAYVQGGLRYASMMTDEEKYAWKKVVSEVGFLVASSLAIGLIFGWGSNDEDRYKKLRTKSGPLPIPGMADSEDEFHTSGWLANHALLQLMKVKAWDEGWLPIPGRGLRQYTNIGTMVPIAMGPAVDYYARTLGDLIKYAEGDESALYKRPVGPALWQQEGSPKFENDFFKIAGFTGTTVQPVEGIRKEQLHELVPTNR